MTQQHTVIQSEHLSDEAAAWLSEHCNLIRCAYDDARFAHVLSQAHGLVVRTYTHVDAALIACAGRLRVVGRAGAGLDNIDLEACRARNVEVVYTPDANTQAVVEYLFGLLAHVVRPRVRVSEVLELPAWRLVRSATVAQRQMSELTLGILGLGRVGKRVAQVAAALGFADVLYHDIVGISPGDRAGATPVAVADLFTSSDVVTVHVDGRPSNRGAVSSERIGTMKPEVVFVNTSRGFVVDNVALAAFLRSHPKATALVDVHEPEPFGADYPLLGLPNARLYPHLGASTRRADENMSWVVKDIMAVLEGRPPRHRASST